MSIAARLLGDSAVALWGLSAEQRLTRQLKSINVPLLSKTTPPERKDKILLIRADFLYEPRTLKALLQHNNTVLRCEKNAERAAAIVSTQFESMAERLLVNGSEPVTVELQEITTADLHAFDVDLRRAEFPLLEPIAKDRRAYLEDQLYGNAYKGITDLVTKWLWPKPAKRLVRAFAVAGISPNMVTTAGFLLVVIAAWSFYVGQYWAGLWAGWVMTFLDTVDGKLARVTIQSSRFGHFFDHGIDLLHPPFWYVYWAMSLPGVGASWGMSDTSFLELIILAYVAGRIVEALFPLLGNCSIFTWRPFDAWFRLVTARRNPCLIIMTAGVLLQRPDWSVSGVAAWSLLTSLVLVLRILHAVIERVRRGPLNSWLADPRAPTVHPFSYRIFSATAGAYAPG